MSCGAYNFRRLNLQQNNLNFGIVFVAVRKPISVINAGLGIYFPLVVRGSSELKRL